VSSGTGEYVVERLPVVARNPAIPQADIFQFDLLSRRIRERNEEVVEKAERQRTYTSAFDTRKSSFSTTASEPTGPVDSLYHSHMAHPLSSATSSDRFYKSSGERYYASSTSTLVGTGGSYDRDRDRYGERERRYDVSQGWDEKVAALALRDEFEFSPSPRQNLSGRTQTFTSSTSTQLIQHPALFGGGYSPPQSSSSTGSVSVNGTEHGKRDGALAFINAGSVGNEISRFHSSQSNRSRDEDEEVVVLGEGGYGYGYSVTGSTGGRPPGSSGSAGSGGLGGKGQGSKLANFIRLPRIGGTRK
jgi:hypothetical protein